MCEDEVFEAIKAFTESYLSSSFDVLPSGIEVLNKKRDLLCKHKDIFLSESFLFETAKRFMSSFLSLDAYLISLPNHYFIYLQDYVAQNDSSVAEEVEKIIENERRCKAVYEKFSKLRINYENIGNNS